MFFMSLKPTKTLLPCLVCPLIITSSLKLIPSIFFIKDRATRALLYHSRCIGGLYPISPEALSLKRHHVYSVITPSLARWHQRLGHPSSIIVKQVVNKDKLSLSHSQNSESICEACQCAKSHQRPYPKSNSVSHAPLEIIFSDVWGHARDSFGRKKILC